MADRPMCMLAGCCSGDGPHDPIKIYRILARRGLLPAPIKHPSRAAIQATLTEFVENLKEYRRG